MKYESPKVVLVVSASATIQGGHKGSSALADSPNPPSYTIGAYEADE